MSTTPTQPRVRFAPSPTGLLHIGGARTAIYNWAYAKHFGGSFILRIDDTDPERSTQENTDAILHAMNWLGLSWDEGPGVGGNFGPYFQTQRFDTYTQACKQLADKGRAYPCFCSAEELEAAREEARQRGDSFQGYPGIWRDADPQEVQRRLEAGEPHVWRLRIPDNRGAIEFEDCVHGHCSVDAKELDDFVLIRSDGTPTYNFATVVDDARMQITHIVRGDDHLSNTPRQVLVYEALEYPVPIFAHLSMILGQDGKRLSKRHGATSVQEYYLKGYLPEAMINYLALLGWSLDGETTLIDKETLCASFDLDRISKNPAVFDEQKLLWMNAEYIKAMSPEEFCKRVMIPELSSAGYINNEQYQTNPEWFHKLAPLVQPRIKLLNELIGVVAFLFTPEDELSFDEKSVTKNIAKEGMGVICDAAIEALESIDETEWNAAHIDAALEPLPEKLEASKKKVFQAVRVGVCTNQVSPPLAESMELLGKKRCLQRMRMVRRLAL